MPSPSPEVPVLAVIPFALLLLGIAILPLVAASWWSKNANKALFAALIALPTTVALAMRDPHLLAAAGEEYFSFIILIASLYVVSGGVVLRGDLPSGPLMNTALLGGGAALASLVGTTGASMLLIRPLLRANRARDVTTHLSVFFIFIVSNAGGLLTPLGDPPLFLGFLRGVPFTWTLRLYPAWLTVNGTLLALFAFIDWRATRIEGAKPAFTRVPLSIGGIHNLALLGAIVACAATLPFGFRELGMAAAALVSDRSTKRELRAENGFTYHPVTEVAILFAGIFVTMQPALALLRHSGPEMGLTSARELFFVSGILSSVLDNAPTYLTFFTVAQSLATEGAAQVAHTGVPETLLVGISLGSVLMGANTYIGNGPNFMVKSICDEAGFKTPSFFGYIAWSLGILGPIWLMVGLLFVQPS